MLLALKHMMITLGSSASFRTGHNAMEFKTER